MSSSNSNCNTGPWIYAAVMMCYIFFFSRGCNNKASHWEHYLRAKYQYEVIDVKYNAFIQTDLLKGKSE